MLRDAEAKCGRGGLLRKLGSPSAFLCEAEHQEKARVLGRGWSRAVAILRCPGGRRDKLHASGCWLTRVCTQDLKGSRHRVAAWNV